jgi:hypothetical protein
MSFEGVNLKSYTLVWRLSPRSQQESDQLKAIIDLIKMRTHPAEVLEGFALDYPDLIFVTFTGAAAEYLPIMHKAMVTNFQVNYGNGSGLSLFKSGAPTDIEIALTIQEINIITRTTLENDAGGQ